MGLMLRVYGFWLPFHVISAAEAEVIKAAGRIIPESAARREDMRCFIGERYRCGGRLVVLGIGGLRSKPQVQIRSARSRWQASRTNNFFFFAPIRSNRWSVILHGIALLRVACVHLQKVPPQFGGGGDPECGVNRRV